MTWPASAQLTSQKWSPTTSGASTVTKVYRVDYDDMLDLSDELLSSRDAIFAQCVCYRTDCEYIGSEAGAEQVEMTAVFSSSQEALASVPNAAPAWKLQSRSESFTIQPNKTDGDEIWVWSDNAAITNQKVLPLLTYNVTDIVLFGASTYFTPNSFASYIGKTNAATFLTLPIGTVLYTGVIEAEPSQTPEGAAMVKYAMHLHYRSHPWNEAYREDTSSWVVVRRKTDSTLRFPTTDMSGLLLAPTS
jgi:hypothetical protein